MASVESSEETSQETLTLINHVLDFIRGNLSNIEKVWGRESSQYRAASQVMEQYLDENLKKLKFERSDLDDLMQKLSLNDSHSDSAANSTKRIQRNDGFVFDEMEDVEAMNELEELEESFISDVVSILRENIGKLTAEQEQDLTAFEAGKLDFDTLFSKDWHEDGTWKDQLSDLSENLMMFKLDADDASMEVDSDAETTSGDDSKHAESESGGEVESSDEDDDSIDME